MARIKENNGRDTEVDDLRWKDLYTIGGISCIIVAMLIVLAVIAYFIWPYKPGSASTESIFLLLQNDRPGGLLSLDLSTIVITLVNIVPLLALYVALRRVNGSYALIALVLGLVAVSAIIPARPLAELVSLSDKFALATTDAARSQYLSQGDLLLSAFSGTAWMVQIVLSCISGLISSLLMLRSRIFDKTTAYVGIFTCTIGLGFFIPAIGTALLFLNTIATILWYVLVARTLLRVGRQMRTSAQ